MAFDGSPPKRSIDETDSPFKDGDEGKIETSVRGGFVMVDVSRPSLTPTDRSRAYEYLRSLLQFNEVTVKIDFDRNEDFDISLTPNMVIRAIRSQRALSELVIGDQILKINGKTPLNAERAYKQISEFMPTISLIVSRIAYKSPVPADRAAKIQLRRQHGYHYFLTTVKRVDSISLGLGIKGLRGKISVNRTDENSLASYIYLVGDTILDINGTRVSNVAHLRNKMIECMKRERQFTTIVERANITQSTHNVHWIEKSNKDVDPPIANDVFLICQREIMKHRMYNPKHWKLRSIYKDPELAVTQVEDTVDIEEEIKPKKVRKKRSTTPTTSSIEESVGKMRSKYDVLTNTLLDLSSTRKRRKKKKRVVINVNKNEEEKISTDVQNPIFLQHVKNVGKQGLMMTLLPKFLRGS